LEVVVRRLIGREEERAELRRFLVSLRGGPGALVLAGEAGIGKSSLWWEGVSLAREEGFEVLEARPAEAEARWAFAGLGDLLDGVLGRVLSELPAPQRRALEVAVLRLEPEGATSELRAIGVAFLGVLRLLSGSAPLLCAIDDVQWLDRASAGVLEFAGRRVRQERVGFLLSVRKSAPEQLAPLIFARAFAEEGVGELQVCSLSRAAIEQLLRERLAFRLSRGVARRVFEASEGSPFYALELGRALERRGGEPAAGEPLPMPAGRGGLVAERLAALSHSARQ
jgi:predicted ATPase